MLTNNQNFDSIAVKCMTTNLIEHSKHSLFIDFLHSFHFLFLLCIWSKKYFNTGKIEMKNIYTWQIIKFVATARFMCIFNTCFKAYGHRHFNCEHIWQIHPLNWGYTILFISTWTVNTMNFDLKILVTKYSLLYSVSIICLSFSFKFQVVSEEYSQ